MLHGDLSNVSGPVLAISYENLILRHDNSRTKRFFDRDARLNWSVVYHLRDLWEKGLVIYVVSFGKQRENKIVEFLDKMGVTFTDVVKFDNTLDFRYWLDQVNGTYIDSDKKVIQQIYPRGVLYNMALEFNSIGK